MAGIFRELVLKRYFSSRSKDWAKVRKAHLKLHPYCECCGKKKKLGVQVHHIVPFSIDPSRELDMHNLLTLCNNARCHLDRGHLGDWRSWNWNVKEDCKIWLWKYTTRPRRTNEPQRNHQKRL